MIKWVNTMNNDTLSGAIEALLFASGEPLTIEQLSNVLQIDNNQMTDLLLEYQRKLQAQDRGLLLQKISGGWQLATKAAFFPIISKLSKISEKKLSSAALETLSIIAFKQPVTKQEIEKIRGVKIESALSKLLEFELIHIIGHKTEPGCPIIYGTTNKFLSFLGIDSLADLKKSLASSPKGKNSEQLVLLSDE